MGLSVNTAPATNLITTDLLQVRDSPLRLRQRGSSISTVSKDSKPINHQLLTALQAANWIFNS
jgi:hypothetical protein